MRRAAKTRDDLVNLICDSADVRYRSLDVKFVQNLSIFAWVEMFLLCLQKVSGLAAVTVVGGWSVDDYGFCGARIGPHAQAKHAAVHRDVYATT